MSEPTIPTKQKAGGVERWTSTWSDPRKSGEKRGRAHMRRFGRCDRVSRDEAMRRYRRWLAKEFPTLKLAAKANYSVNQLCKDYFDQMSKRYIVDGKYTTSITRIRIALESLGQWYGIEDANLMTAGKVSVWLEGYIHERIVPQKGDEHGGKNHLRRVRKGSPDGAVRGRSIGMAQTNVVVPETGQGRDSRRLLSELHRQDRGKIGEDQRDSANLTPKPRTKETCNLALTYVKRMYRWGAKFGKVSDTAAGAVQLVENLRSDHPELRKKDAIRPVAWATVEATKAKLPKLICDYLDVLWLTGMRPGEGLMMRPCDIEVLPEPIPALCNTTAPRGGGAASANRGDVVRVYTPRRHKTTHKAKVRKIVLGPRAWRIIEPLLPTRTDAKVFPIQGNLARLMRQRAKLAGVEEWTPNQIRHSYATRLAEAFGAEMIEAVLGHSNEQQQRTYIERSLKKAMEVARQVG